MTIFALKYVIIIFIVILKAIGFILGIIIMLLAADAQRQSNANIDKIIRFLRKPIERVGINIPSVPVWLKIIATITGAIMCAISTFEGVYSVYAYLLENANKITMIFSGYNETLSTHSTFPSPMPAPTPEPVRTGSSSLPDASHSQPLPVPVPPSPPLSFCAVGDNLEAAKALGVQSLRAFISRCESDRGDLYKQAEDELAQAEDNARQAALSCISSSPCKNENLKGCVALYTKDFSSSETVQKIQSAKYKKEITCKPIPPPCTLIEGLEEERCGHRL